MRRAIAALTAVVGLAFAGGANAATFCVHQPATTCPLGAIDDAANLHKALTDASTSPGATVDIGPGTFTSAPVLIADDPGLAIVGSGSALTTITGTGGAGDSVLDVDGLVSNLAIAIPAGENGLALTDGQARDVVVSGGSSGSTGVSLFSASLVDSTVTMASRSSTAGVMLSQDGPDFDESSVSGSTLSAFRAAVAVGESEIDHSTLIGEAGLRQNGSTTFLDTDVIRVDTDGGNGVTVADAGASGTTAAVTLQNVTIDGFGAGGTTTGLNVAGGSGTNNAVQMVTSIVWDMSRAWSRSRANNPNSVGVTILDSIIPSTSDNCGSCTTPQDPLNENNTFINDPELVNPAATDLHLRSSSIAIDAIPGGGSTTFDLDGNPRPVDGKGNGVKRLDWGAYEYQHRAPSAVIAAPDSATPGTAVGFDGSGSSDPDDGDTLTYAWAFGDGTTATTAQAPHAYATPGTFTASLTVTDPTGLTSTATHVVTVAAPPAPPAPPTSPPTTTTTVPTTTSTPAPPPPKKHTPPKLTGLRISHGKLKLTLSETATVTVAEEHTLAHGRHHTVRTLRHKLTKGAHTLSLGKLAKGHYRLVVRATDSAGSRSSTHTLSLHET